MRRINFLFVLVLIINYSTILFPQEIQSLSEDLLYDLPNANYQTDELLNQEPLFYYDKIIGDLSTQLTSDQLLENLTRQIWNETSSTWVNDSLYEYSYNDRNLLDTFIVKKWSDGIIWGNKYKETYSYNSNSRLIFSNEFYWEGYWQEYYRYYYTYYGNGNLWWIYKHTWHNPGWLLVTMYTYSYTTNNDTAMIVTQVLDIFHGNWIYSWKDVFDYDTANVLIMKTGFNHYYFPDWMPEISDLYFYDNYGNRTETIRQDWYSTDSIWVNDYRYLYEYDLNNVLLSIVYQDWQQDSLNWKNVWRETYTYTLQNNIATMFKETWTPETGWNNYVFRIYSYDENYNWTEKLTQLWDGTVWKNYYRHLATWLEPVTVQEEIPDLNSFRLYQNYPNPFNPSTKIKFTVPFVETTRRVVFTTIVVYDVVGNEIATLVNEEKSPGSYEVEFNVAQVSRPELTSGVYFYQLKAGSYVETKKMILLK